MSAAVAGGAPAVAAERLQQARRRRITILDDSDDDAGRAPLPPVAELTASIEIEPTNAKLYLQRGIVQADGLEAIMRAVLLDAGADLRAVLAVGADLHVVLLDAGADLTVALALGNGDIAFQAGLERARLRLKVSDDDGAVQDASAAFDRATMDEQRAAARAVREEALKGLAASLSAPESELARNSLARYTSSLVAVSWEREGLVRIRRAKDHAAAALVNVVNKLILRARGRLVGRDFVASLDAAGEAAVAACAVPDERCRAQLLYEAHEASAAALQHLGRLQEALDHCKLAVAAAKDVAQPEKPLRLLELRERHVRVGLGQEHRAMGNSFFARGIYEDALEAYNKAAIANPECPLAPTNAAAALLKLQRWTDAAAAATVGLALDSQNVKGRWRRAVAYEQLGRLAEAYVDLVFISGSEGYAGRRAERVAAAILAAGGEVPDLRGSDVHTPAVLLPCRCAKTTRARKHKC